MLLVVAAGLAGIGVVAPPPRPGDPRCAWRCHRVMSGPVAEGRSALEPGRGLPETGTQRVGVTMDGSAVWSRETDVDLRDGSTAHVRPVRAEEVEAVPDTGRPVRAPKAVVRRSIQEVTPGRSLSAVPCCGPERVR